MGEGKGREPPGGNPGGFRFSGAQAELAAQCEQVYRWQPQGPGRYVLLLNGEQLGTAEYSDYRASWMGYAPTGPWGWSTMVGAFDTARDCRRVVLYKTTTWQVAHAQFALVGDARAMGLFDE